MYTTKRIAIFLCLCLILAGCGGSGNLEPFEGKWKETLTGLIMTVDAGGSYTMTDNAGTETGKVWHDRGEWYIFEVGNGPDRGVKNKFKLTVNGNELSLEIPDGTVLKFDRIS